HDLLARMEGRCPLEDPREHQLVVLHESLHGVPPPPTGLIVGRPDAEGPGPAGRGYGGRADRGGEMQPFGQLPTEWAKKGRLRSEIAGRGAPSGDEPRSPLVTWAGRSAVAGGVAIVLG